MRYFLSLALLILPVSVGTTVAVSFELTDAAGPFERAFCPSPCTRVAHAHRFPGTDAGKKIANAIAALPSGIGGYVDATGFKNPQNISGFTIPSGVTVRLAPVFFTMPCGVSITIHQGGQLHGGGTNSPGSTQIKLFNNCNHAIIKAVSSAGGSNWWHAGEIRNLRLDGNKANNTTGNCMEVWGLAETSLLQRLDISNCKQAGLLLTSSNSGTGTVENVTVNSNGTCGIQIDDFKSGVYLKSVGGDNNPSTLCITNPNNGGGSIYINDFKSEKTVAGPAVTISGGNSPITLTLAGGNALQSLAADTTMIVIENSGGLQKDPIINIQGMVTSLNYSTLINDQKNNVQVTSDAITYHGFLSYTAGKSVRFDKNGFVTVP